jgi:hypothetical protein
VVPYEILFAPVFGDDGLVKGDHALLVLVDEAELLAPLLDAAYFAVEVFVD